ncbi:MAG: alpha-1,3-galactosidase B [Sediminibacterium sp.]|nr:alpha-1,3-galactosidase B [Sediminibacterium sp.]
MKRVFLLLLIATICSISMGQDTIKMMSLGLNPNSRINTVSYINKALQKVSNTKTTVILFEKGRYDFWEEDCIRKNYFEANTTIVNPRVCPIYIFRKKNLVINAQGAEFIFHGKAQPFTIDSSENITIQNVSIDWDIPFSAEAEITDVSPEYFDLSFDTIQFPYMIENGKLFFIGEGWKSLWGGEKWNDPVQFDRETLFVTAETDDDLLGDGWEKHYRAVKNDKNKVRIYYKNNALLKKGNYLVLRHSVRDHSGMFITESIDVKLENINMYSNSGMNFLAQYTQNITYRNVNCIPSSRRKALAGHDDGLHHTNCKGHVLIDGCSFKGIMDDGVNFHNTYLIISEKLSGNKLKAIFKHHQSMGFVWARSGEEVGFIQTETMHALSKAKVKSFKLLSVNSVEIEFSEAIPDVIKTGDALENLEWNPSVEIRNSYFGQHRARGLLVSTPERVLITNNIFESSGAAICIPGDANHWYEGGSVNDVTIANNIFRNCNTSNYQFSEGIISIQPTIPKIDLALPAFHKNIKVLNNTFEIFDAPLLYAFSVTGLSFNNNVIKYTKRFSPRNADKPMITLNACKKVEVVGNKLDKNLLSSKLLLVMTKIEDLKYRAKQGIIVSMK